MRLFQSQNNIDPLFKAANKYREIISAGRITADFIRWSDVREVRSRVFQKSTSLCVRIQYRNCFLSFYCQLPLAFIICNVFLPLQSHLSHCNFESSIFGMNAIHNLEQSRCTINCNFIFSLRKLRWLIGHWLVIVYYILICQPLSMDILNFHYVRLQQHIFQFKNIVST